MIYPCEGSPERMAKYEAMLEASHSHWEDFTTGKKRKAPVTTNVGPPPIQSSDPRKVEVKDPPADGDKPIWKVSGMA